MFYLPYDAQNSPFYTDLDSIYELAKALPWEKVRAPDGTVKRQSCWLTKDCPCKYKYSNTSWKPKATPDWLKILTQDIVKATGVPMEPHGINCNLYEGHTQYLYFHADNEPITRTPTENSTIISLSIGATREFRVMRNFAKDHFPLALNSGDLVIMGGTLQKFYQHMVAKGTGVSDENGKKLRFNFTWRFINHEAACHRCDQRPLAIHHRV